MRSKGLRAVVEDDNFVNNYFQHLSPEKQRQALVILTEDSFQRLLAQKEELKNCSPKVDLQFEQEVLAKGRAAVRPSKHKFFGFWKRK